MGLVGNPSKLFSDTSVERQSYSENAVRSRCQRFEERKRGWTVTENRGALNKETKISHHLSGIHLAWSVIFFFLSSVQLSKPRRYN